MAGWGGQASLTKRILKWCLVSFAVAYPIFLVYLYLGRGPRYVTNLKGAQVSLQPVIKRPINFTEQFPESFPLQVAVLLTRNDEGGMGLVHAFREKGIPFFVTRDLARALHHSLLFIYPEVDAKTFSKGQAQELAQFVERGGKVFAQNVFWGALKPLF